MSTLGAAAVGSAVSGGLGIIGSLVNYGLNKRLAEQQNEYNIDMWNMQNEYNSPQAQMQRFAEAGLNPNLIYGQGSSGNSSSAPQMVVPGAPELSKDMQKLGEAFNIENLRTVVANRKRAQAEAKSASIAAQNAFDERAAMGSFGDLYSFDPVKGTWVFNPGDVVVTSPMSKKLRSIESETGAHNTRRYLFGRLQENQYRDLQLIPYRAALYEMQRNYLAPQVTMANYEASHYPISYWIGQGTKVANGLTAIPKTFSPLQWTWRKK